jgi:hypothetical protein
MEDMGEELHEEAVYDQRERDIRTAVKAERERVLARQERIAMARAVRWAADCLMGEAWTPGASRDSLQGARTRRPRRERRSRGFDVTPTRRLVP